MSVRISPDAYFLILLLIVNILPAQQSEMQYEIHTHWKKTCPTLRPIDVNQDGEDEILMVHQDQIDLTDQSVLKFYASFSVPKTAKYSYTPLATGRLDSLAILRISFTPDSVHWRLLVWEKFAGRESKKVRNYLSFSGFDKDGDGKLHQSGGPVAFFKHQNGETLQLYILNTGRDLAKRGLMAVRPATGEVVWEYLFGPQVANLLIFDLDGNGDDEILVGSYAPQNGRIFNDIPDDSSYVFLFSSNGHLRWRQALGGIYTGAIPALGDINGDGIREVLAYRYSKNAVRDNTDELLLLDLETGKPGKHVRAGKQFTEIMPQKTFNLCQDFNGDGKDEMVVANSDGIVRMFGANLQIIKTSPAFEKPLEIHAIADFTGDKIPEIVLLTSDNRLIVLNDLLEPLVEYPVGAMCQIHRVKSRVKSELLLNCFSHDGMSDYTLCELRPVPISKTVISHGKFWFYWLIPGVFVMVLVLIIQRRFWGRTARKILFTFLENARVLDSVLIIRRDGKVMHLGKHWEQRFGIPAWQVVHRKYEKIFSVPTARVLLQPVEKILKQPRQEVRFEGLENRYFSIRVNYLRLLRYFLLYLNDLTEEKHQQQVQSWTTVAQRLAHSIKNPLTTVKLNAEDLIDLLDSRYAIQDPDVVESLNAIITQAEKLTRMSDGFMRFVQFEIPKASPLNLNQQIQERVSEWMPAQQSAIQVKFELKEGLPDILFDTEQFVFVLKTIFFNAVESLEKSGRILITTNQVEVLTTQGTRQQMVEMQIHDNGKGIPAEFLEKVFQPFFTRKKTGTGLGLHIALKVMQTHGGTIHLESEENIGTTVTLRFRLATN